MLHNSIFKPDEIFIIGAGGTGSRICSEMAFFVRGNFTDLVDTWTTIIDHDHVSNGNLNRQLYFPHEVGNKSKGQVLTLRYRDLFRIRQVPQPINADSLDLIFTEEVMGRKNLVICAADNGLVVKQVYSHFMQKAENDYLVIFTGANLKEEELPSGITVKAGSGQAFAYGVINKTPLFPAPPTETLLDIMALTGYGPTSTGQNCGVDDTSGAQTPLMNLTCCQATMTIINYFFEQGVFIPSIYFTDGLKYEIADHIIVDQLLSSTLPTQNEETNDEHE